jgi:hypothetical protein
MLNAERKAKEGGEKNIAARDLRKVTVVSEISIRGDVWTRGAD